MDFLHDLHGEDRAIGLAREFIGAVRGAHGDGERVDLGLGDEIDGLARIGQQLVVRELALGAVAVLLLALARLERAEHAQFAFDRGADPVRKVHHVFRHAHIVIVIRRRLAVGFERAVHHDRGEAEADRRGAGRFAIAMVLMHDDRNVGIHDHERLDHLGEHRVIGVGARAARSLDDDRRIDRGRRLQHGQPLLHIVDVEGRNAIVVFGGVVEQLAERDEGHGVLLDGRRRPAESRDALHASGGKLQEGRGVSRERPFLRPPWPIARRPQPCRMRKIRGQMQT